jgi:hypothetical protein
MEAEDAEVNGQSALIFHAENKPYSS